MRLVSLNTWKGEGDLDRRLLAMAEALVELAPDVVALQEDLRSDDGSVHTAGVLARVMGMHLQRAAARPKVRKVAGRDVPSTSGMAVLCRERALEQRVLELPIDARDGQRVAQCVRLPDSLGGGWLINLHLSHLADRPDLRRAQLAWVLGEAACWAADQRWILCGDFNAQPNDIELASSLHPVGPLIDAFGGMSKITHTDSTGRGANLDHILIRPRPGHDTQVQRAWLALNRPGSGGVMPSDHVAVCADLDQAAVAHEHG